MKNNVIYFSKTYNEKLEKKIVSKNVSFRTLKNPVIPKTGLMGMNDVPFLETNTSRKLFVSRYILNAKIREIDFLDSSIFIE